MVNNTVEEFAQKKAKEIISKTEGLAQLRSYGIIGELVRELAKLCGM